MEIVLGAAAAVAIVSAIGVPWGFRSRKKSAGRLRYNMSTLTHLAADLDVEEKIAYKSLNNHDERIRWLQRHFPEFLEAAEHCPGKTNKAIARHLDLTLIDNVLLYSTQEEALADYLDIGCQQLSLDEYQARVDIENKKSARESKKAQEQEQRESELLANEKHELLEKLEQERKPLQEAADVFWNSLPDASKIEFKRSFGKVGRLYSLPSALHTGYTLNEIHSIIMATHFPHIEENAPRSISYYEAHAFSKDSNSPYLDTGSSSSFSGFRSSDSGSSFSDGGGSDGGGGGE